ncbi:MAG: prkC 10 [Planctomycetaceae bacterium]|nr:prkC 10 [Planctomycetaceae bacterium]
MSAPNNNHQDNELTALMPTSSPPIWDEMTHQMPDRAAGFGIEPAEMTELLTATATRVVSKQERDFVLASQLIRGKYLTERMLRTALRHWTPFGGLSLREYLRQERILSEDVLLQIEREEPEYLKSLGSEDTTPQAWSSVARRTSSLLERVDPTGRIAKVFGLSQIPKAVVGDETRTFRTKFRLIRKLGQGGLGTVWLAVDTSLNRYVAVKEICDRFDPDSAAVARFRREAEITGRLDHPSIVPVHILGENEHDGRVFYVMRFLGNETLADAIREYHETRELGMANPLAFHRLLTAFASVCQAIAYAHSNKVIHRDLKPQNIALDNFGQVIVLDWGLAKTLGMDDPQSHLQDVADSPVIDSLDVTLAGQVVGTPMYMAPEQASGRVDEIDERTDVYGLGAILFSILTGFAPHELSQESLAPGSKMSDLLDMIVDQPTTRPRKLNPEIPIPLEAICLKAIAKERCARYQSASALSEDLQRWLANEPISAIQDPFPKRFQRWMAKHRRLSQTLALCATLMVAGLVGWGFNSYQHAVAVEQRRIQGGVDDLRDIRAKLTYEIETLSENTRFMSTLPPIQAIIDAQRSSGGAGQEPEGVWAERLKVIFNGLLDVNPSYVAVTYWVANGLPQKKPIRVESAEMLRGAQRTDLTEFFGRHLPAITALVPREIYVGMPGRIVELSPEVKKAFEASQLAGGKPEPVGECLVAGVSVHDKNTDAKLGGVAIECNLEKILIDHMNSVTASNIELYLTDHTGRCVMRFTRENGLRPIEPGKFLEANTAEARSFFADPLSPSISAVSPTLCAAKVPLNRLRPDYFMGLLLRIPQ